MSEVRVALDGIWKKFRKGSAHDSLRDLIPSMVRRTLRPQPANELAARDFWALRDVSFEVKAGEALGIIGRNGAGKSTTLKILTRVLAPTRGTYFTRGRVGALIEVAAGFHPDLTGRENIFLQSAILGMHRSEVEQAFDSIVAFAGVEPFIDTPIKRYSSGMNARLGFAVAAHLRPDVLIIDEVLSVGDMAFQSKCIERMHAFKREGVAIVFVSHNMQAVSDLCDRALHLDGAVVRQGEGSEVISAFLADLGTAGTKVDSVAVGISVDGLFSANGTPVEAVAPGDSLHQTVLIRPHRTLTEISISMLVTRSTDGLRVYDATYTPTELGLSQLDADAVYAIEARFVANLLRGQYHVTWHVVHNPTGEFLTYLNPAAVFRVDEYRSWAGVAELGLTLSMSQVSGG